MHFTKVSRRTKDSRLAIRGESYRINWIWPLLHVMVLLPVGESSDTLSSAMRNTQVTSRARLDEQILAPWSGSQSVSLSLSL